VIFSFFCPRENILEKIMFFQAIAHSWVAKHPCPIGVVEFLGGALFGTLPTVCYRHFLQSLYQTGYTVIAVPFRFGFNHEAIAHSLLEERDQIRAELQYPNDMPHFWVGHSLGCKYIALLESQGKIMNQPSLLIAPDISDTQNAIPHAGLADWLDRHQLGARPTRQATQVLIQSSRLFHLTALISFDQDCLAGTCRESSQQSDVAWFSETLAQQQGSFLVAQEIPGWHEEPIGIPIGRAVYRLDQNGLTRQWAMLRQLEPLAIEFLFKLASRRGESIPQSIASLTGKRSINWIARLAFCFSPWEMWGTWGTCDRKSTVRRRIRTTSPSSRLVCLQSSCHSTPSAHCSTNPIQSASSQMGRAIW
jgi:Protein of unknown function (DUF1350)